VSDQISDADLRRLVLEVLSSVSTDDWGSIAHEVVRRVAEANQGSLGRHGEQKVHRTIIGLFIENLVTIGNSYSPRSWPSIKLTDLGESWVKNTVSPLRDPDGYASFLKENAPGVEPATIEYAVEAFRCLQQSLFFACAVMIGAAAEREVFRLGKAMLSYPGASKRLQEALERGRLPALFQEIRGTIEETAKSGAMPYSVHQGSVEHLFSFQEMVRVQRNEAVHSGPESITRNKVFLSIQTFPSALGVIDRLRSWYEEGHVS
jgi:hypothetical protein